MYKCSRFRLLRKIFYEWSSLFLSGGLLKTSYQTVQRSSVYQQQRAIKGQCGIYVGIFIEMSVTVFYLRSSSLALLSRMWHDRYDISIVFVHRSISWHQLSRQWWHAHSDIYLVSQASSFTLYFSLKFPKCSIRNHSILYQ